MDIHFFKTSERSARSFNGPILQTIFYTTVTIPDDVDLFNALRMIKGLDTKNSPGQIT
jgi:hypothetical protein